MHTDKKSRALLTIFIILLATSIAFTYYRYLIAQDFTIIESEEVDQTESI